MAEAIFAGSAQWVAASPESRLVGLFRKQPDDGDWQQLQHGLPADTEIRAIARHPTEAGTLLVATQVGPYRSKDNGDTWHAMNFPVTEVAWSILYAPDDPDTIYCGTVDSGVYCSTDCGSSWHRFTITPPAGECKMGFPTRMIGLAADRSRPEQLYAALEVGGLVRSLDSGNGWQSCNPGLLAFAQDAAYKSQLFSDTDTEGMMDSHALATTSAAPGSLFLANRMGLFRSDDGGLDWHDLEIGRFSPLTYARDVVVSPHDPMTLYAAFSKAAVSDEGSLYRSVDLGQSWQRFDHGVTMKSTLMTISASAESSDRVYCAARRGQVFGTEDGGLSWTEHPLPRGVEGVYAVSC